MARPRRPRLHRAPAPAATASLRESAAEGGRDRAAVPGSLRDAVQTRARRAGPEVETLLRAAVVVGAAFDLEVVAALVDLPARLPLVWDPHPRGPAPVPGARLATPNHAEAAGFAPEVPGPGLAAVTARARLLAERWAAAGVAVTLGPGGARRRPRSATWRVL
jgi:hypothetical protein